MDNKRIKDLTHIGELPIFQLLAVFVNPSLSDNKLLNNPKLPPGIQALVRDKGIRRGKKSELRIVVQEFKKKQVKKKAESKTPEVKSGLIYTP